MTFDVMFAEDLIDSGKRNGLTPRELIVMRHDLHLDASVTVLFNSTTEQIILECDQCEGVVAVIQVARRKP